MIKVNYARVLVSTLAIVMFTGLLFRNVIIACLDKIRITADYN